MNHPLDNVRMDRTVLNVYQLGQEPRDRDYWLSVSPSDRLDAIELLRMINYGYDPATTRLQRILTISERGKG